MNKFKEYTLEQRKNIAQRLHDLIKSEKLRKCDVEHSLGLRWLVVHNIAELRKVPHAHTCMLLDPWLTAKENELNSKRKASK